MISKTTEIKKGQHRVFRIIEQKLTSTIVLDLINEKAYPCRKLYMPKGKDVLLFIKKINKIKNNEHIWFEYSLLNEYSEDQSLEFDIIAKTEAGYTIENNKNKQHFLPSSICAGLNGSNRVKLTIQEVNIEENKLIFVPSVHSYSHDL